LGGALFNKEQQEHENAFHQAVWEHSGASDLSDLQRQLSPVQWEAVSKLRGPCLLLSGAGSGKTRVLTFKMAALIRSGICRPHEMLAVTFTNKAAGEMKERASRLLGSSLQLPWLGTFHSIGAKFLRIHADRLGYQSTFTIYDREDQKRAYKNLIKELGTGPASEWTPETLKYPISQWKNKGKTPEVALSEAIGSEETALAKAYAQYQKKLKANNAMDFDDLLLYTCLLFRSCEDLREKYQRQFKAILIDEFQDTNQVQYDFIKLLLGEEQNLTLVGDDDQSIYGWRGAEITHILNFQKTFPQGKIIEMGQNYRSTANIIGVAGSVIAQNRSRLGKKIWTENPPGDLVSLRVFEDEVDEATWVALQVAGQKPELRSGTAVFYRTNAQSRAVEDAFRRQRLPYKLVGAVRFYDRREVKDLLAYLQTLSNPLDSVSLGRIINIPKRGIGEKTIEYFVDKALAQGQALWQVLETEVQFNPDSQAVRKIKPFVQLIQGFKARVPEKGVEDLIEHILEATHYLDYLAEENEGESIDRSANVQELVVAAAEFEERNPGQGLSEFLQEIALYTEMDAKSSSEGAVSLMTVHSSKGLEFPTVYLTGLEEGLFPLYRDDAPDELEEERRLFYVAVTRAEKNLSLSYTHFRKLWNRGSGMGPSRFLLECDPKFIVEPDKNSGLGYGSQAQSRGRSYEPVESDFSHNSGGVFIDGEWVRSQTMQARPGRLGQVPLRTESAEPQTNQGPSMRFSLGQRVSHPQFGVGTVQQLDGRGDSAKIHVLFGGYGRKTLMLKFAKLSPCD